MSSADHHLPSPLVLIVEDDRTTSDTLRLYLEHAGYRVEQAFDGEDGLDRAVSGRGPERVDLVLLDLMLPGLDGLSICRALRPQDGTERWLPILMLTARSDEADRVRGLDLGADDYLVKPFSPRELVARVRALLRRMQTARLAELVVGDLCIEPSRRRAAWRGEALTLTPTEFELLALMATQPERVFGRAQLIEQVLGHDFEGNERAVDAHIKNLRRKIEAVALRMVHTVFGVGYRFSLNDSLANSGPNHEDP